MPGETAVIFIGVSKGYDSKQAETITPEQANHIVRSTLDELQASIKDKNTYHIYSGLAVYRKENGCPEGGEPVAAVVTAGGVKSAINTAELLRATLNQSTVTVASYIDSYGKSTLGFCSRTNGDLHAVAKLWQDLAAEYFTTTGTELTCGLYLNGTQIVLQGELNPEHGDSHSNWKDGVQSIIDKIGRELDQDIPLHFRDAGFTYLVKV